MAIKIDFTDEQKARITQRLRTAAIAQAEFWDVLRQMENEHGCEIEPDVDLISELAGECSCPPSLADLQDDDIWASFLNHSRLSCAARTNTQR
jgi:hypothetical protein